MFLHLQVLVLQLHSRQVPHSRHLLLKAQVLVKVLPLLPQPLSRLAPQHQPHKVLVLVNLRLLLSHHLLVSLHLLHSLLVLPLVLQLHRVQVEVLLLLLPSHLVHL